jgi:hypothetical protein
MKKLIYPLSLLICCTIPLPVASEQPKAHAAVKVMLQGHATPEEVISKVRAASHALKSGADLAQFNAIEGNPWVWKDSYIFVYSCEEDKMSAHPIKEELIGRSIMSLRDYAGNLFFEDMCNAALEPNGGWVKYAWPKPGDVSPSPKFTYNLQAQDSKYQVAAGIYSDSTTLEVLKEMLPK